MPRERIPYAKEKALRCRLHGCGIGESLPRGCPMRSVDVCKIVLRIKDLAHALPNDSPIRGRAFREADACGGCVCDLMHNPKIVPLRQQYKAEEAASRA